MTRLHGTRTKYVHDSCRCDRCTEANTVYAREAYRARRPATVPAVRTRRHLIDLSKSGVGRRTIAETLGMSPTTIQEIRSSGTRRVTRATETKILSIEVGYVAGGVCVPAGDTRRRIEWLKRVCGMTPSEIARRLGTATLQIGLGATVRASTAEAVEGLYDSEKAIRVQGRGGLTCGVCGDVLIGHSVMGACWKAAYA